MTATVGAFALTAGMIAAATGGRVAAGPPDRAFEGASIDSRTVAAGALFIALKGPRFDGHAFIGDAVARGAAGVLVSEPVDLPAAVGVVMVADTLDALQQLGREVRRRSGSRVVAITGSTGKTTTKEITADLLAARFRVVRNAGNLNNHIGLPLSLLDLRLGPDAAVVELGMNHPGEIRALVWMAEPNVRVWTNVGDAHIGHFASREAIADAKAEILEMARPDDLFVANADDALVMAHAPAFLGRRVTFGERAGADVRATDVVDRGFDGTSANVETAVGRAHVDVHLPGRAQLSNVLAAVAVAIDAGVPLPAIEARTRALRPLHRRGSMTTLASGTRVVDDSYNASPAAVRAMLDALRATPTAGRRIAVLGEMLELGDRASALHLDCGRAAAESGVDLLVAIGGAPAAALARGAEAGGLAPARIVRFATSAAAAEAVAGLIRGGDLVLVKASRGTRADLVADRLKEVA